MREYIASKPKESRARLEAVRRAILKALPNAQEGLAYQMPAYTLNGVGVLYFAGWKSHYSLYPASDALVEAFAKELAPYERSKGTLKFPLSEPVPARLIPDRKISGQATDVARRGYGPAQRRTGRTGRSDTPHLRRAPQRVREDVARHALLLRRAGQGLLRDVCRAPPRRWTAVAVGAGRRKACSR